MVKRDIQKVKVKYRNVWCYLNNAYAIVSGHRPNVMMFRYKKAYLVAKGMLKQVQRGDTEWNPEYKNFFHNKKGFKKNVHRVFCHELVHCKQFNLLGWWKITKLWWQDRKVKEHCKKRIEEQACRLDTPLTKLSPKQLAYWFEYKGLDSII